MENDGGICLMVMQNGIKAKNIILLRKSPDSKKNLFLVHDGTGSIGGYFQFAWYIHQDFNVYGILPIVPIKGEDYLGPFPFSIKDIADSYRGILDSFMGDTVVYITGWSTGGSIAFEMVYGWQKEGRRVNFLGLFDVLPPENEKQDIVFYNIKSESDFLLPFIAKAALKEKLVNCEDVRSFWNLIQWELTELDWMREKFFLAEGNQWGKIIPNYQKLPLKELFLMINVIRSYHKAGIEYLPEGKVENQIHYFQAAHSVIKRVDDWRPYCHRFICHQVPGGHYTMLNSDNAPALSEIFNKVLGDT